MEGLLICNFAIKIISVKNISENRCNEWNEVNYYEELRKTKSFVLEHDEKSLKLGITILGKEKTLHMEDDNVLRMYMQWIAQGYGYNEQLRVVMQ